MTSKLYEKQQLMARLQAEIEEIQEKNQALEQDFENEINKKNQNTTEVGQIINSINNIYMICQKIGEEKGRKLPTMDKESEHDPELVANIIYKLQTGADYMEDLVSVLNEVKKGDTKYEDIKEKVYEDIAKQAMGAHGGGMGNKPITPGMGKKMGDTTGMQSSQPGTRATRKF